jgi:hypothetical protein
MIDGLSSSAIRQGRSKDDCTIVSSLASRLADWLLSFIPGSMRVHPVLGKIP